MLSCAGLVEESNELTSVRCQGLEALQFSSAGPVLSLGTVTWFVLFPPLSKNEEPTSSALRTVGIQERLLHASDHPALRASYAMHQSVAKTALPRQDHRELVPELEQCHVYPGNR